MSLRLDPRIHAYRRDLADIALAGRIIAPHYARPVVRSCGAQATPLRAEPHPGGSPLSELLPGEEFAVLEYASGWAWGYCTSDHLVGYVEAIALSQRSDPTHVVCEKCAPVAADGRITSPVLRALPMGSRLQGKEVGACLQTEYGCVSLSHLRPMGECEADPAAIAERMINIPYREGGRSFEGVDGPGLVHLSLSLCGLAVPRLADHQKTLGEPLGALTPLRRNDLIFCAQAAGVMIDDLLMIHACPKAGKVTVEPVAMIGGGAMERRRLPL